MTNNLEVLDLKIGQWMEYEDPSEDPKGFVVVTCMDRNTSRYYKIKLNKSDLEWIMGIEATEETSRQRVYHNDQQF